MRLSFASISIALIAAMACARSPALEQRQASTKPKNFAVVLFPAFEVLDVFGPLSGLNLLAINNSMNLYLVANTLDPVTTKPTMPTPGNSNFSEQVIPTHTFDTVPDDIDVLIVPGGIGTRAPAPMLDPHVEFIKNTYPKVQYLISVCTGAGLVARTGILDGIPATGNKRAWAWVTSQNYKVKWIAKARWVNHGNIYTTSGVSAGIDGLFAFVKDVYGEDVASQLANSIEYRRELDWRNDPFADLYNLTDPWVPPTQAP